jgi:serine/threonine protein kinase
VGQKMQANGAIVNPGDLLKHRYRVVKRLGKGNFGQTFQVEDLRDRGSRKVLKVLLNYYPKAIELFKREAEVLQQLDCPGIPQVECKGYFTIQPEGMSQPLHCLVMEYVRGQNLEEWLEQNQPIDRELALDWLKQLVEILGLLHDRDYFHRDIKPGNIMRQPDGRLALIDFGAVRGGVRNLFGENERSVPRYCDRFSRLLGTRTSGRSRGAGIRFFCPGPHVCVLADRSTPFGF